MKTKRRSIKSLKLKIGKRAFTLVEIMVSLGIMAILASLLVGGVAFAKKTSIETKHRNTSRTVVSALEVWYTKNGRYCNPSGVDTNNEFGCSSTNSRSFWYLTENDAKSRYGLKTSDLQSPCICGTGASKGGKMIVTEKAYYIIPAAWNCSPMPKANHLIQGAGISEFTWASSDYY